jgi:septal ring factor EnvC (AmiA/AmiB activator)
MRGAGAAALLLGAALALALGGGARAAGPQGPPAKHGQKDDVLRRLQKRIEREQRAMKAVEAQRATVAQSLQAIEQSLADQEERALRAERQVEAADKDLAALRARIADVERERNALEDRLARRIVALYKFQRVGYVRILLSSKDDQDLARRSRFLRRVIASDADLVGDYRAKLATLRQETARLDAGRTRLADLEQAAKTKRSEVQARRQEKVALLGVLSREKDARLEALRDLERAADELQGAVDTLRHAEPEVHRPGPAPVLLPGAFEELRGRLPLPVEGRIIRRFGLQMDPELGTQIRSNGITVRAPYGAPIRAVSAGQVLYAGWFRGYGRILIVNHGDGYYTLVAHASELLKRVGDTVRAGEEMARVGDSGSLEGPIVYFEIRKQGKPVDPSDWIHG